MIATVCSADGLESLVTALADRRRAMVATPAARLQAHSAGRINLLMCQNAGYSIITKIHCEWNAYSLNGSRQLCAPAS